MVGGSTGIGFASAKRLLKRGVPVQIVSRRRERLDAAVAKRSVLGPVEGIQADLSDADDVGRLLTRIASEPRHVVSLVNAAGSFNPKRFLEHTRADYDQYMALNQAFFFITQAVAHNMRDLGR